MKKIVLAILVFWPFIIFSQNTNLTGSLYADSMPPKNLLILRAEGDGGFDKTQIVFNPNSTADYDKDYDSPKTILANNRRPQIFTFADDFMLSINQLPDTTMIDLAVLAGLRGEYTLSVDKNIGFEFIILEDLIWQRKIDLLKENYSFEYFESDGHYPFKIYFKSWVLEPLTEGDVFIYYYPENIVIESRKQIKNAQIMFYDLSGREAYSFTAEYFFRLEKPIHLPTGHYIVQLSTSETVVNKKILVRK
jgi:hypothetical protein